MAAGAIRKLVPFRLAMLSNRMIDAIARVYARRFHLSVVEWRVMSVLGCEPGLSASDVVHRTGLDKVAVSRAVARLLAAGRLHREADDHDRRRSVLRLSEAGHQIHEEAARVALAFERRLLAGLDRPDRTVLLRLLGMYEDFDDRVFGVAAPGLVSRDVIEGARVSMGRPGRSNRTAS